MTQDWDIRALGDVCRFLSRGVSPTYLENGGIVVLNQKCVRNHVVDFSLARRHSAIEKRVHPDRHVRSGDVLINSTGTGTLGRVAQVLMEPDEPTTVDSHVTIARPVDGVFVPKFFGYALVAFEEKFKASGEGCGGQIELARSKLASDFNIRFPSDLAVQQRIVAILDEAFAGIATARANAEQSLCNAREMFESHLQAVFIRHSEDWVQRTLREVAVDFGRGKSKHRPRNDPKLYGGPHPFIQTGDVRGSRHLITGHSQTYSEAGLAQSKLWPRGTLCITIAANIAETGILDFDACFPDSVIGVVVNTKLTGTKFLEYLLQSFKAVLQAQGKGSAQANINLATFENQRFPFPSLPVQKSIVTKLDALAAETHRLEFIYQQKLTALDELKQSLLERAFSGAL